MNRSETNSNKTYSAYSNISDVDVKKYIIKGMKP